MHSSIVPSPSLLVLHVETVGTGIEVSSLHPPHLLLFAGILDIELDSMCGHYCSTSILPADVSRCHRRCSV